MIHEDIQEQNKHTALFSYKTDAITFEMLIAMRKN